MLKKYSLLLLFSFLILGFLNGKLFSQQLYDIGLEVSTGLNADQLVLTDSSVITLMPNKPLFSFQYNDIRVRADEAAAKREGSVYRQLFNNVLTVSTRILKDGGKGWKSVLTFENVSTDTISISNVLPFIPDGASAYITGYGPWNLARAYLYRPGYRQVRVILPDNAWELGYISFNAGSGSVCALARRQQTTGGQKKRYDTTLPPGAKVTYNIYADVFTGEWQNGLRLMFRDRYLYDLEKFDNTLFEREDLKWIKDSYIIILQMAWDREFFDRTTGKYTYAEELKQWNSLFNNIDVFGIWPTWPRLGIDQRNQWDMYRDLPGGIRQLRTFAIMSRQYNTRFFIAYNPWDNSTRKEDHYKGMARLISEIDADGVVLDTSGSSSSELQATADSVKKGVIMFSEGMAVTKDMPGIIAGRVHNAIYYSPELNLNKLIKPDFSIFRVCDVGEDRNHREIAIAFFNGYGTELNLFRPGGRGDGYREDLNYLSRTTFILRQNNDAFLDYNWTPLINTTLDNVYVNKWDSGDKTVYTILNMRPEGVNGKLFKVEQKENHHFVSLWSHENLSPETDHGIVYLSVSAPGWDVSESGTRLEGSVSCIACLPDLLKGNIKGDSLSLHNPGEGQIILWTGNPSYQTNHYTLTIKGDTTLSIKNITGYYEGKIVLQYLENNRLKDENVLYLKGGKPWIVTRVERTREVTSLPYEMVLVPGTKITYTLTTGEDFMPYPNVNEPVTVQIDSFLIDKYPVTNDQFYNFLVSSGYVPVDTSNFLKHWESGIYKQGQEKYPVVYVSHEDMLAYAKWAGKRLPTEAEWQLAAQSTDGRKWPWGDEFHGTWCNNAFNRSTPVDAFAKGASPYGVYDLVGNVWQATNDMYFNGTDYFLVIRGGSYYKPDSSWWYVQGGPQQLDRTQIMLMVSQGFDRCATVGFRCVKDINPRRFGKP
jgi:iron(II)-dependent oxidoreductase